jgi:transcriptional regulator with XRE-family HTH domain
VSQRGLARLCGVAQPSISAIERGDHDTKVATLDRVVAGFGAQVAVLPSRLLTAQTAASVVAESLAAGDEGRARSAVFQLADDLAQAPLHLRVALTVSPAQRTGDFRFDGWISGLVEHRLAEVGISAPDWVAETGRKADVEWLVSGVEALRGAARATTPEPLRRRGVLIDARDLASV